MPEKIKTISLFSGAGIGELRIPHDRFEIVLANELLKQRADCYHFFYPSTRMLCGDITDKSIKEEIIATAKKQHVRFLIATPPCQGVSSLGKNKKQTQFEKDERNYLILHTLEIIDRCDFDYVLIENVPRFIEMYFPYQDDFMKLEDILVAKYGSQYYVDIRVLNAKDYGIAQSRPRAIIKLWKKHLYWAWPVQEAEITLRQAIGHLPSLEPGEDSGIAWHQAKAENERAVLAVRHTAPGKSAIYNPVYYPKKEDGTRIKGFHNTYKRMVWNQPCPARTTYSGSLSSHNNVHPGHLLPDGTYSDPRVLTLLETFIVSSIPEDIRFPEHATDSFIRTIIGEAIPPRLMERIVDMIGKRSTPAPMSSSPECEKWILYKHTSSFEMVKALAIMVKTRLASAIGNEQKYRMQKLLAELRLYKPRAAGNEKTLDSINHRINTLEFYLFGYEDKREKKFIFSPLGNLFLKYIDNEEALRKIFTAMLFGVQFQHPANGTPPSFRLYPFRLLMKLMSDNRLGGRLYHAEYVCFVPYIHEINENSYEDLVGQILRFRGLGREEQLEIIFTDEHTHVKSLYEYQYYTLSLLSEAGVVAVERGEEMARLAHPQKPNSRSATTYRKLTTGHASIPPDLKEYVAQMLAAHSPFDKPVALNDKERMKLDAVKEVYAFYPRVLLEAIGEADEAQLKLLELPRLIEQYANNPDGSTAYLFEDVLEDGFNLFFNVEARKIGGAGHTDIECLYLTQKKKFAIEAKSTEHKLSQINAGRLREHRQEIGGRYTIVVTPRYVPAVRRDIAGTPIVIILANTLSEYLYNHLYHDNRHIDYAELDAIIEAHLGEDVSQHVSGLTMAKFATSSY